MGKKFGSLDRSRAAGAKRATFDKQNGHRGTKQTFPLAFPRIYVGRGRPHTVKSVIVT